MPNKNNNRIGRIDEEYKKVLSQIIGYELKNPNVTGLISVTKVKVTNDLKYAKVYVSILNAKNTNNTLQALKKSAGFIRSSLARRVNLRNTPEIIFEKGKTKPISFFGKTVFLRDNTCSKVQKGFCQSRPAA